MITVVVPLAGGVVLWLVTGSAVALALGGIGPVVTFGTWFLERVRQRSSRRTSVDPQGTRGLDNDVPALVSGAELCARGPGRTTPVPFTPSGSREMPLVLGSGDGGTAVTASAGSGVAIIGARASSLALARALIVQVLARVPEARVDGVSGVPEWEWLAAHSGGGDALQIELRDLGASPDRRGLVRDGRFHPRVTRAPVEPLRVVIVVADAAAQLPFPVGVRIELRGPVADTSFGERIRTPDSVSEEEARAFLTTLRGSATGLPALVTTAELAGQVERDPMIRSRSLDVPLGVGEDGEIVRVDLVRHGPHALVAGATGSGKSELLLSWVLALAERASPTTLSLLLIDFKGGATFAPLAGLPHAVGIVSDLDGEGAERAVRSLAAEVRRRERVLRDAGVRDWVDLDDSILLPRLVIVVDEFAALVSADSGLVDLFADVAARGRSLGMNLILCAQRPTGCFRESIAANCPLRVCLRVRDPQDARWMGAGEFSAMLPSAPDGRALVSHDREVSWVQVAREKDVPSRVRLAGVRDTRTDTRPWLDPLPDRIMLSDLDRVEVGSVALGRFDLPDEQRQPAAVWHAGGLLIVGGPGSGKTSACELAAAQRDVVIVGAEDPEAAWDAVVTEVAPTLVVDDLDRLISIMGDEHALAWTTALETRLRDASGTGDVVVCSVARSGGLPTSLASAFRSRIALRQASEHEHALLGLPASTFRSRERAGAGWWDGNRVQLAVHSGPPPPRGAAACVAWGRGDWTKAMPAVVSGAPWLFEADTGVRALALADTTVPTGADPDGGVPVGDVMSWLARPSALAQARSTRPLVFHRCSSADYRAIVRGREPPPLLARKPGRGWLQHPDGRVQRISMTT